MVVKLLPEVWKLLHMYVHLEVHFCYVSMFFPNMSLLLTLVLRVVLTYHSIKYVITYVPFVDWFIFPVRWLIYMYNIIHISCVILSVYFTICSYLDWIILSTPMYIVSLCPLTYVIWCTCYYWSVLLPIEGWSPRFVTHLNTAPQLLIIFI